MITRVVEMKSEQLQWSFDGATPYFSVGKPYHRSVQVDPFPCYAHDAALVRAIAERVEEAFPIGFPPDYYVLHHETTSRTNGHADRQWEYNGAGKERSFFPWIVLSGKRIPPHPAMTRYLVAHEYGHVVQNWIEYRRGDKDAAVTEFDKEYIKMRPDAKTHYGGRKWHDEVGELIANDFRICVTGIETEFWPHPGFEHPLKLDVIRGFWARMIQEFASPVNSRAMAMTNKPEEKAA